MIHTDWGWMALVGSTVLLPDSRGRRLAAAGLGALVLALAALQAYGFLALLNASGVLTTTASILGASSSSSAVTAR